MAQSYFLTGALGCIGAWTVKALAGRGARITVFDKSTDRRRLEWLLDPDALDRVRFITGDLTNPAAVDGAMGEAGATRVIHLAGMLVPACQRDPVQGALVNVTGALHVFEAARRHGVARVVYASSAAVYGPDDGTRVMSEASLAAPDTHYGVFKRANEGNARVYALAHGLSSVGLRPYTVYGVGRDTGITADPTLAMKAAVLGRPFHVRFGGLTDMQYAADTAAAFVACADRAPDGAHVFNLHGDTVDVRDIVAHIERLWPDARGRITWGGPPIPIAPRVTDAAFRAAVPDVPVTLLETGIADTLSRFAALAREGRLDTRDLDAAG